MRRNPPDEAARQMNCPNGITASGNVPVAGVDAACGPSYLGKRIRVNGQELVCSDRGGAIHDGRVDIYLPTYGEALQYGKRTVQVEVL